MEKYHNISISIKAGSENILIIYLQYKNKHHSVSLPPGKKGK